jgi:DNA gyrase subunit B
MKRKALYPVKQIRNNKRGTIVTFILTNYFTQTTEFSYDTLSARMRECHTLIKE